MFHLLTIVSLFAFAACAPAPAPKPVVVYPPVYPPVYHPPVVHAPVAPVVHPAPLAVSHVSTLFGHPPVLPYRTVLPPASYVPTYL